MNEIDISDDLRSFLKNEYDRCRDDTLDEDRENAIDRYNGEPYGDEEDGSSQVVARDTAETIDYMVISILRTIISGERVVEFVHKNSDAAHEATETIMHLMMDEQDGYRILHDWLKAGLLEKNAVAMTYPEPQQKKRVEGIIPAPLLDQVDAIEAEPAGSDPQTGMEIFRVVTMQEQQPKFCDAAVPNEEFYISPEARDIDSAPIKGRRVRKTLSELVELGVPREDVEHFADSGWSDSATSLARDEDRWGENNLTHHGLSRQVWWHEEFVRFDANDDGIAELLYIQRSADYKVYFVEEMEDEKAHPFVDWCPFPMPHRRIGQSLADKVMDIERIRTVLLRQSLDGIYISNNPSTYLHEDSIGANTIEDLLTVKPGRLVRWKGAVAPVERGSAFDPGAGFNMLEFMNRERETRTGITRLNMGLDEDTLNQTAKGQAQLIARGEQVEEYIARNFANAVARLITKKARLLQRYGGPIEVPIDGEYRMVDPRKWPEDMIARARVGLGASRKEQRLAFRREVIGMQAQAMEAGLPIVDASKFYNSAKGFITDAGLGDVSEYFVEPPKGPDGQPLQQPAKPDPEMVKVQGEQQRKNAEFQAKVQGQQFDQQLRAADAQAKQGLEQFKAQQSAQLALAKAQQDAALDRQRAQFEAQLAQEKAQYEAWLADQKFAYERAAKERDIDLPDNRPGGDLDK